VPDLAERGALRHRLALRDRDRALLQVREEQAHLPGNLEEHEVRRRRDRAEAVRREIRLRVLEREHRAGGGRDDRLTEAQVVRQRVARVRHVLVERVVDQVQVVAPVARVRAEAEGALSHVPAARERQRDALGILGAGGKRGIERVRRRDQPVRRHGRAVVDARAGEDVLRERHHAYPAARGSTRQAALHRGWQHRVELRVRDAHLDDVADHRRRLVPVLERRAPAFRIDP
jgi:hypothetical protein